MIPEDTAILSPTSRKCSYVVDVNLVATIALIVAKVETNTTLFIASIRVCLVDLR